MCFALREDDFFRSFVHTLIHETPLQVTPNEEKDTTKVSLVCNTWPWNSHQQLSEKKKKKKKKSKPPGDLS